MKEQCNSVSKHLFRVSAMHKKKDPDERKRSQGYVDLKKNTDLELKELLERQEQLLKNRSFIMKLPDKGGRLVIFKSQIEDELERRSKIEDTCEMFSELNIVGSLPEEFEWGNEKVPRKQNLDSDDDSDVEVDPLKLVATHSGTIQHSVKVKTKLSTDTLVTAEDIAAASDPYIKQLCLKYGAISEVGEKFMTNKPKTKEKSDVSSAEKVKERLGAKWEVTAATPPVPIHEDSILISLEDSLLLQKKQAAQLKEIEMKRAAERLRVQMGVKMGDALPVNNITQYRSQKVDFEGSATNLTEGDELQDIEEQERGEAVFYNLIDDDDDESGVS